MGRWQALVFDLDDTLFPERDFVLGGFLAVAEWAENRLGIEAKRGYAALRTLYESGVRSSTFNQWLRELGCNCDSIIPRLVKIYREHLPSIIPFPEVKTVLERIHIQYRVGLISDGYIDVQRRKFAALHLDKYFDAVVFSDEWGRDAWKPNIKPFVEAMRQLNVIPSSAIYIADNPLKDFLGARQIGIYTVRILRSEGEYASFAPPTPLHAPDQTITNLNDLIGILSL